MGFLLGRKPGEGDNQPHWRPSPRPRVCSACVWDACCLSKKKQVFGASRTVVPLPLVLRRERASAFRSLH